MSDYILCIYVWHTCNLVSCNKLRRQRETERERHAYMEERSKHDPADAQLEARPSLNQVDKSCRDCQTRRLLNPTGLCKTCCPPKPDALDVCMSWRRSYSTRFTNIIWTCTAAAFIPLKLHPKPNCIVLVTTNNIIIMPWGLHFVICYTSKHAWPVIFVACKLSFYAPLCVALHKICTLTNRFSESALQFCNHYWNLVDLMSYSFVNVVTL